MSFIEIVLLAIGLSMDAFAVSVCKGLSAGKISKGNMLIAGLWFGGFQALMPLIGFFLAGIFADSIEKYDHWIAFVLLAVIGGQMIKEAFSEEENLDASFAAANMLMLAIATSIDALAVGVALAFLKVNIIQTVSVIGIITFAFSVGGVKIGSVFGMKYKSRAEFVGGVVLVLIGLKILLEGLGIIG